MKVFFRLLLIVFVIAFAASFITVFRQTVEPGQSLVFASIWGIASSAVIGIIFALLGNKAQEYLYDYLMDVKYSRISCGLSMIILITLIFLKMENAAKIIEEHPVISTITILLMLIPLLSLFVERISIDEKTMIILLMLVNWLVGINLLFYAWDNYVNPVWLILPTLSLVHGIFIGISPREGTQRKAVDFKMQKRWAAALGIALVLSIFFIMHFALQEHWTVNLSVCLSASLIYGNLFYKR
jgi:hypothetical protein